MKLRNVLVTIVACFALLGLASPAEAQPDLGGLLGTVVAAVQVACGATSAVLGLCH